MNIRFRILIFCWLTICCASPATGATLSGHVYDRSTDKPLAGASVALIDFDRKVVSDSAGYFQFADLEGGLYDVEVSLTDYHNGYLRRVRLGSRQDVAVEVRLKPITAEERAKNPNPAFRLGRITGTVTRAGSNEALPGAVIRVQELAQGAQSDVNGKYIIDKIKPGRYTIDAIIIGFKQVRNYAIEVYAGEDSELNFVMEETVLPLGSEVIVYGERPLMDPTVPAAIRTIQPKDIAHGTVRDLAEILKELPGVIEIDKELHIRGGRTYETQYMIDGVSVSDPLIRRGYGLSLNANSIKELNLYSGGANAEFSQATSGIVEVTTREGQNRLSGTVNYRNDHFMGKSGFNTDLVEGSFSGPEPLSSRLLKSAGLPGRTFFFWSGNFSLSDTYLPYSSNLYSSTLGGTSFAPRADNQYSTLMKLTWKISPLVKLSLSHSAAANINQDRSIIETRIRTIDYSYGYAFDYGENLDNYNTFTQKSNQQVISLDYRLSLSKHLRLIASRFFTTLRSDVRGKRWTDYIQPSDNWPDTIIASPDSSIFTVIKGDGFWDAGDGDTWYDHYIENYGFKSTYETEIESNYKVKVGVESEHQTVQVLDIYKPWLGESGFGLNYDAYKAQPSTYGAFVQNNLNLQGMVFDFGFRYDLWFVGKYAEDALANDSISVLSEVLRQQFNEQTTEVLGRRARGTFSPRFGIANLLSRNLTLFGSYSRFARKPAPQYLYAKLYTPSQAAYQLYGNPALDYEKVTNIEVGLKYLPNDRSAIGISGYIKYIGDYIAATAIAPDPRFPDETYFLYFNLDYATSQGVELEYVHQYTDVFSLAGNCAFSKARGERSLPADILRGLRARSEGEIYNDVAFDWDKPWQFVLKANFNVGADKKPQFLGMNLPSDWNLNIKAWGQAGKRYTPYRQTTDEFGFVQYVPSGETNSKIGPWWNSLDLSFQKYFRSGKYTITFYLEGTNILDHQNVTLINPLTGEEYREGDTIPTGGNLFELPPLSYELPLWANPTKYLAPRQVKFGLGVSF